MKLSTIDIFESTPLNSFFKTILFNSNNDRDTFFSSNIYITHTFENINFNRRDGVIRLPVDYLTLSKCNYMRVLDGFTNSYIYYYLSAEAVYINDGMSSKKYYIDSLMTFCQDNVIEENAQQVYINRQSLSEASYQNNQTYLLTNNDVLATSSQEVIKTDFLDLSQNDYYVLWQSSIDLGSPLADSSNNPLLPIPKGMRFDNVTSPIDIYLLPYSTSESDSNGNTLMAFNDYMEMLQSYPIALPNFQKIQLIPKIMFDSSDLAFYPTPLHSDDGTIITTGVYRLINDHYSSNLNSVIASSLNTINYNRSELLDVYQLNQTDDELLRSPYCLYSAQNWCGQNQGYELGFVSTTNWQALSTAGYSNSMAFYIASYKNNNDVGHGGDKGGQFLNSAIYFNEFNSVPILINNGAIDWQKGQMVRNVQNQEQLANYVTGTATAVAGGAMSAVSGNSGGVASGFSNLLNDNVNNFFYYQNQKAQKAQTMLENPSVTEQNYQDNFMLANDLFGLSIKYARASDTDILKAKRYYSRFGFQFEAIGNVESLFSNSISNYLKIDGLITIPDIAQDYLHDINNRLQNGVVFFHNNNTPNPFTQSIEDNVRL